MHLHKKDAGSVVAAAIAAGLGCGLLLIVFSPSSTLEDRVELTFANQHEYLDGFKWTPPFPKAGPPTPAWVKTPASVGQGAENANDPAHRESNVLGGSYKYPDYARSPRASTQKLRSISLGRNRHPIGLVVVPQLWVGSPAKMLPPSGDYPGGSTGIPEDGYIAYETGYANDGPFHGELAPMQEAGIASSVSPRTGTSIFRKGRMLSILDPGSQPAPFNDWDIGNFGAPLDNTYRPAIWDNPDTQPIDWINAGKLTCVMGGDCHDNTHQGGLHDNGNQQHDNFFTGSIDPNSDKSINPEYARQSRIRNMLGGAKI